jgi:hypothetical protein
MAAREEYQGFVPITIHLADVRIEGQVWKLANHRLLEHLEADRRAFLPVVQARVFRLEGGVESVQAEHEVIAVNKSQILTFVPGDTVTPFAQK